MGTDEQATKYWGNQWRVTSIAMLSRLNISNFPKIVLILVIYQEKFRKKYYTLKENNKN